ncbi:hypothetical protein Ancab_000983, partial [Ancistrocladus abbreviatus]
MDSGTKEKRSLNYARLGLLTTASQNVNATINVKVDELVYALSIIEECQCAVTRLEQQCRSFWQHRENRREQLHVPSLVDDSMDVQRHLSSSTTAMVAQKSARVGSEAR